MSFSPMTPAPLPERIPEAHAPTFWYAAIEAHDVARVTELLARQTPLFLSEATHSLGLALYELRRTKEAQAPSPEPQWEQVQAAAIVDALLTHPAVDWNAPIYYGATALMLTARFNQEELAARLLARGVDVHALNLHDAKYPKTALLEAAKNHCDNILALLLDHGANPNDTRGYCSPLAICFDSIRVGPFDEDSAVDTVQILLAAGADPNQCDHDTSDDIAQIVRPPLWYAVRIRDVHAAQALLEAGARMDWQRPDGAWEPVEDEFTREWTQDVDGTDETRALLASWRLAQHLGETLMPLTPGRRPRL